MRSSTMIAAVRDNTRRHEQAFRDLERAVSQAHGAETRLQGEIAASLRKIASLHLEQDAVTDQAVRDLLDLGIREEAGLREQLAQVEAGIAEQLVEKDRVLEQITSAQVQAGRALESDEAFRELQVERSRLAEVDQPQAARYAETRAECEAKLQAFQAHDSYQYLVRAGYGSQDYRGGPLRRFLDGWVARQCNFAGNRSSELTLRAMLEEIGAWEGRSKKALARLEQQLQRLREQAGAAAGLPDLITRIGAIDTGVQRGKRQANKIHGQIADYSDGKSPHYQKAQQLLESSLKNKSTSELLEIVARTPDDADDEAARQAVRLQEQLARQQQQTRELQGRLKDASRTYERARELERRLDTYSYTSSSYQYRSGLDMSSLLTGYMSGTQSLQAAESKVRHFREDVPREPSSPYSSNSNSWESVIAATAGAAASSSWGGDDSARSSPSASSGGDYETTYSL